MPSLKELRGRINSVKSTKKITSAMKMVAASKLKRAQGAAEAARPYAEAMQRMLNALAKSLAGQPNASPLLAGTGRDQTHLLVVVSADRGLAGGFNSNVGRAARNHARKLRADGKTVKFLPIGRKGADYLEREFRGDLVHRELIGNKPTDYAQAASIGAKINDMLSKGEFDVCTLVFNRFNNVMSQTPITVQLIPLALDDAEDAADDADAPQYEFEPDEETILARLLPQNLSMQIYRAMLESAAGEQGARMTAMDSATRNAGKMIDRLTLNYNRTRQANITKELIEIISGAEAV
jgi:F-type H+-transporting ATPase subunit gamma